ncbi:MAG: hypothetical protein QXM68_02560 [Candidatus Aenigmatarchaeota archaeon]|nr:hypothetical protein [Candidatus Aenigmarchaeota archaeon]
MSEIEVEIKYKNETVYRGEVDPREHSHGRTVDDFVFGILCDLHVKGYKGLPPSNNTNYTVRDSSGKTVSPEDSIYILEGLCIIVFRD